MAKNVIMMIGDGMGWEMARAAAIQEQIDNGAEGNTLTDFYVEGKGTGLSFQELNGYAISTTSNTFIDGDKGNSALEGDPFDHVTGESERREGFEFDPSRALVEGFFPDVRDPAPEEEEEGSEGLPDDTVPGFNPENGFNEEPLQLANGEIIGGNVPIYNPELGGELPWLDGADPEYIKNLYPDSAGTATALYTGVKTYVGAIGVDIFEESVETLAETALNSGKSTGVVSSVPFSHATPAAAVAHVNQRNKYHDESLLEEDEEGNPILDEDGNPVLKETDEFGHPIPDTDNIFRQIVDETQPTVVLGGGHPDADTGFRYISESGYNELVNGEYDDVYTFLERGENASEVLLETAAQIDPEAGERLFGLYGARGQSGNLPWRTANSDYSNAGFSSRLDAVRDGQEEEETDKEFIATEIDENPTLMDMTTAALNVLGDDEDGFWLSIEGGDIDWAAHDNNLDNMNGTTLDFAESVEVVKDWIEENGGYEENLLIVTADHDHYFTLNEDYPELLREIGAEAMTTAVDEDGNFITEMNEDGELVKVDNTDPEASGHYWGSDPSEKYGWGTHTTRPVPVYYQGDGGEFLEEAAGTGYTAYGKEVAGVDGFVDQVHIAQAMYSALTEDEGEGEPNFEPSFGSLDVDDIAVSGSNQLIFAGAENDVIDATEGEGSNRLFAGTGDDITILGTGDRVVGGEGEDLFFAQTGGDNTITGGKGKDQFWIAVAETPEAANTITDFEAGTDVIGIAGFDADFGQLEISNQEGSAVIALNGNDLAYLDGIEANSLTAADFAFV